MVYVIDQTIPKIVPRRFWAFFIIAPFSANLFCSDLFSLEFSCFPPMPTMPKLILRKFGKRRTVERFGFLNIQFITEPAKAGT